MQKSLPKRILSAFWPALIGALFGLGLVLPVLKALDMTGTALAITAAVMMIIGCTVAGLGGRFRLFGLLLSFGLMVMLLVMTGTVSRIGSIVGAIVELVGGESEAIKQYGPDAALVLTGILCFAGWSMAKQSAGFYPAMSLTMVGLLIIWFSGHREAIWLFTPALIALCAMFARSAGEETPLSRVLIASGLAVALALMVTPSMQFRSPAMESFAENLRNYITDNLFFTDPRNVYSIQADGFKPLQNRLGGPVEIEERPVMTVGTTRTMLLRGTIYNVYNGLSWTDTLSSRRYNFSDPRNRATRTDVMDEQRPTGAARQSDLFKPVHVSVTMNSDSASTVFLPLRVSNLTTPMSLVPYFNLSSEIFITRNLEAGDTYSFSAPAFTSKDSRLPGALAQVVSTGEESRDMDHYMRLPDMISSDIYSLTNMITSNVSEPLDVALAIQDYLQRTFDYTLTPEVPPDNQDFVSYFLLRGKEGYCTYFASAMAVMGRIAGLPTRYIEGYLVEPTNGTALVTSKQAHAWAEVYFDGFGWVAFDATLGESRGGPRQDETPTEQQEQEAYEEDGGEGDDEEVSPVTENPTPMPPEQNPEDDPNNPAPNEDPGGDPESEDPEQEPESVPSESDELNDPLPDPEPNYWWLWLLLALAVIGLITWRWMAMRPEALVAKQGSDSLKLLVWYRALLGLLAAAKMPARTYETPVGYALRVEQGVPKEAGFFSVAESVVRLGYGKRKASPADVAAAAKCYKAVSRAVPLAARIKWALKRLVRGVGSVKQIP